MPGKDRLAGPLVMDWLAAANRGVGHLVEGQRYARHIGAFTIGRFLTVRQARCRDQRLSGCDAFAVRSKILVRGIALSGVCDERGVVSCGDKDIDTASG